VATPVLLLLWWGLLLGVASIDVGGYLVAAARAQHAADAAALAAVGVTGDGPGPVPAARTIAERNDGRLERCDCTAGRTPVSVAVSVPVPGIFVPRVAGAQRVTATADATLVHDPELDPRHARGPVGHAALYPDRHLADGRSLDGVTARGRHEPPRPRSGDGGRGGR
jgi:hypothetical protein